MEEQGDGSHVVVNFAEPSGPTEEVFAYMERIISFEAEDIDNTDDSDGNSNIINIGNLVIDGNGDVDNKDVADKDDGGQVEDAGAGAETDEKVNQHSRLPVEEVDYDPQSGVSRKRTRGEDAENEEWRSKRFSAWRENADSDSEEDPLPGGSGKRTRGNDNEDEESVSSKRFRAWMQFADSDSEEDPRPGGSKSRSRKRPEDKGSNSSKCFRQLGGLDLNDSEEKLGFQQEGKNSA